MKTYKKLYERLCSWDNLMLAYKRARKGKTKKNYVIKFEINLDENLEKLQSELINKIYKPRPLKKFIIRDPKTRKIYKSIFRDRIVHHAIINILEPIYEKLFIYDSYAFRKNKGQHKALERFDCFKRKISKNGKKLKGINDNNYVCGYVLKADIKHYFQEVNHEVLFNILRRKIADEDVIWLIEKIIVNFIGKDGVILCGMPLGNFTSQFFANVYLNELDYFVKHVLKVNCYIRYVDDFVILHNSKEQLEKWKSVINDFLRCRLKIELHNTKSRIMSLHEGIQFLGYKVFYYNKLLRRSNVREIKRKLVKWKESYSDGELFYQDIIRKLEGWFAHARHGETYNLRKKVYCEFEACFY